MVHLKTPEEIELMRLSNLLVASTHAEVAKHIRPGVTTEHLDAIAEEFICDHGARPAFKGYGGFPSSLCISENNKVVHGIPGSHIVSEGDILSIDCGVELNGYYGDSAFTYPVAPVDPKVYQLVTDTIHSLYLGISQAIVGNKTGDIGFAIQNYTQTEKGYGVVRELVGHGVGTKLHEDPEVPNYGKKGRGKILKEGTVIAIEPMINLGSRHIKELKDGWTIVTADGAPSAHFEHTIAVTKNGPDILSDFERIFDSIKTNEFIADFDEKIRYLQANLKNG